MADLPLFFVDFLKRNNISPEDYIKLTNHKEIPRYICINPLDPISISELQSQLGIELKPSILCKSFYEIDHDIRVGNIPSFKNGQILSMDISSALAIQALELEPNDHYLDLCCAPGAKLCMAGMMIQGCSHNIASNIKNSGSITGVDISKSRLSTCRSLVKKYKIGQVRLFCMDGTLFNIDIAQSNSNHEMNIKPFYASTMYRRHGFSLSPSIIDQSKLYTKILIDAECTHDGSIKHVIKMMNQIDSMDYGSYFHPDHESKLQNKQFELLCHGFSLLRENGLLVYCTCSLTDAQNSQIVTRFLQHLFDNNLIDTCTLLNPSNIEFQGTRLVPISIIDGSKPIFLGYCIAFDPILTNRTSGFFIARLRREL